MRCKKTYVHVISALLSPEKIASPGILPHFCFRFAWQKKAQGLFSFPADDPGYDKDAVSLLPEFVNMRRMQGKGPDIEVGKDNVESSAHVLNIGTDKFDTRRSH